MTQNGLRRSDGGSNCPVPAQSGCARTLLVNYNYAEHTFGPPALLRARKLNAMRKRKCDLVAASERTVLVMVSPTRHTGSIPVTSKCIPERCITSEAPLLARSRRVGKDSRKRSEGDYGEMAEWANGTTPMTHTHTIPWDRPDIGPEQVKFAYLCAQRFVGSFYLTLPV